MSLCPFAVKKLLPENDRQARIVPVSAIWHSAVDAPGPTSLYGYFARADVGLESHFFIKLDGTIEQYMDTHVRADANFRANSFFRDVGGRYVRCGAVSVETEDDGNPDQRVWTPAQVESSIRLGRWIRDEHRIPAVLCPTWDGNGFGYHTLFPNDWTNVRGKTCPGRIRIPQFKNIILPGIAGNTEEDDMHAGLIIAAYAERYGELSKQVGHDITVWIHEVYSKPPAERDGAVAYIRKALGL